MERLSIGEYAIPEGTEAIIENGKIILRSEEESEDERIRNDIMDAVENWLPYERVEEIRAYLNKQKQIVQWPNVSNCKHDCKTCSAKCLYRKEQNEEQKPAECISDSALQKIKKAIVDYKKQSEHYEGREENFYQYYGGKADGLQLALIYLGNENEQPLEEQKPINQCNTHEPTFDEARKWNEAYEKGYSLSYENGRNEQKPAEIDEYEIIKKHITEDSLSGEVNKRLTECGWYVTEQKPVEWNNATINGEPIPTENQSVGIPLAEWSEEDVKLENCWHKVTDSFPDSTREVICKDAIGNFFIGRYYKGIDSWEVSMYDDSPISNEDNPPVVMWCDIPSEKQKEQKWSEEDETRLKVITEEVESYIIIRQYGTPLTVEDLDWLKSLPERFNLQPKQEWSEEDKEMLIKVEQIVLKHWNGLSDSFYHKYDDENQGAESCYNWLKSLPERFNFQPKQEWSEEDEKALNSILNDLRQGVVPDEEDQEWLKSLRRKQKHGWRRYVWAVNLRFEYDGLVRYEDNGSYEIVTAGNKPKRQTSGEYILLKDVSSAGWKPSEEQMRAVFDASERNDKLGSVLRNLYDDLKKL